MDDFVTVSLVVCEPTEVLYSTLGHAALHLQCPTYDLDYVFTYEGEGVRNKIWKFLKGDLKMGMYAFPTELFLEIYRASGRGVREYTLNLSPEQKQNLWRVMDGHVAEGANIPYDYFHRGCAKVIVQVIHEAIGKDAIHYAPWPEKFKRQTQREMVRDYITDAPWEEFYMYFLIGTEADRYYSCEEKLIIPTDLVEVWQNATLDNGMPMLDPTPREMLQSTRHNQSTWCTPLLISMLLLVCAIFNLLTIWSNGSTLRKVGIYMDYLLLTPITLIGILMTYLVAFSNLPCTDWNWLIVPFNIIPLLAWYWRKYWALPYACMVLVWCLIMAGELIWGHVLVDRSHIVIALSFGFLLLKQYLYKSKCIK